MAKCGPKPTPNILKFRRNPRGTRHANECVDEEPFEELVKPTWLTGRASNIWDEKVARYDARGLSVVGCEDVLAQYCALEADLIDKRRRNESIPTALLSAFRLFATEFFDTPSTQFVRNPSGAYSNPFGRNGKR